MSQQKLMLKWDLSEVKEDKTDTIKCFQSGSTVLKTRLSLVSLILRCQIDLPRSFRGSAEIHGL